MAKNVEAWKRVLLSGSTMPKGLVSSALKAAAKIFSLIILPLFYHSDGWLQNAKSWTIRSV